MGSRIFPSIDNLDFYKRPMCKGSKEFIEFLDSELDSSLEIYIRPFLNGDEPDICILNPKKGLSIFNIIDWDDDNYFYKSSH